MRVFKKKSILNLDVDIHSHLIPAIDDGSNSIDQSLEMLIALKELGYKKIITTPHIHPNYPNTAEIIHSGLNEMRKEIMKNNLEIEIEAAAEYFVDELFLERVKNGDEILSFGDNYVLVESAFLNKPILFEEALFELISQGYKPVLAHPERYRFLEGSIEWLMELKNQGVLFQLTLGSVGGYYGKIPQQIAKELLKQNLVDFLGSDLHKISQLEFLEKGLGMKETQNYLRKSYCLNGDLL
jgi:protein-tyrosine phosphatase